MHINKETESKYNQWRGQGVWSRGVVAGDQGQSPWSGGQGGEAPLKLKSFEPSEERGSWQICHPVKSVNCSNILLENVFVSPLP